MLLIVEVDGVMAAQLRAILQEYPQWTRAMAVPNLPEIRKLYEILDGAVQAAKSGQERPTVDGLDLPAFDPARGALLLTYEQAGRVLSVSERTVRRLVAGGRLPAVSFGRARRIRREDIETFVAEGAA